MYTLEINGKNYPLNFGFDFMKKMNNKLTRYDDGLGTEEKIGLQYAIAAVMDKDVEQLVDVIMTANATESDKINRKELIEWLENDDIDIDAVFEAVDGFFAKANCTKNEHRKVVKMVQAGEEITEA